MSNPFTDPSGTSTCLRCGAVCQVADRSNPDARIMKAATAPRGVCPSCHITAFLQSPEFPFRGMIEAHGVENVLRLPHVQAQMAAIVEAGQGDISADAVDWERVIELWDRPHPAGTYGGGRRAARLR